MLRSILYKYYFLLKHFTSRVSRFNPSFKSKAWETAVLHFFTGNDKNALAGQIPAMARKAFFYFGYSKRQKHSYICLSFKYKPWLSVLYKKCMVLTLFSTFLLGTKAWVRPAPVWGDIRPQAKNLLRPRIKRQSKYSAGLLLR